MSARKVWIVTEGSYSDYRVRAAFTTKEAADAVGGQMEEFVIYDGVPRKVQWHSRELIQGREVRRDGLDWPWSTEVEFYAQTRPTFYAFPRGSGFRVSGRNEAEVDKAWQDRLARWKAEKEGIA